MRPGLRGAFFDGIFLTQKVRHPDHSWYKSKDLCTMLGYEAKEYPAPLAGPYEGENSR
ncbi:hypothetical protein ABGV42_19140 [Paenibacillus pabuli]